MFLILPEFLSAIFLFENFELKILMLGLSEFSFKDKLDDMVELFCKIS